MNEETQYLTIGRHHRVYFDGIEINPNGERELTESGFWEPVKYYIITEKKLEDALYEAYGFGQDDYMEEYINDD